MSKAPKTTKAQRLVAAAQQAAEVRAYQTHPDVAALRIERVRSMVDALVWTGLVLGLLFTMSNVATFAAGAARPWSVAWLIAWLLDPMVSLVLVGLLIGCSILARYQIRAGRWVTAAKWGALVGTYTMNTWSAWAHLNPSAIVLHSVPPALVFFAAEAITDLRDKLTEAVSAAYGFATERTRELATLTSEPTKAEGADTGEQPTPVRSIPTRRPHRTTRPRGRRTAVLDVSDLVGAGRQVAGELAATGQPLTKRNLIDGLRAGGHSVGADRALALLRLLKTDTTEGNDEGREVA